MKALFAILVLVTALCRSVQGQILVVNFANGTVGEYSTTGTAINSSFISGLDQPMGIAISGDDLFISEQGNGNIAEYTTSGTLVNPTLITGLSLPAGIAIYGNDLFVANSAGPTATTAVGEYTLSGTTVNASLIPGIENPVGVATDGNYIYVSAFSGGTVGQYTMSGAAVNAALIGGGLHRLQNPGGLALDGNGDLYVSTYSAVGEYTISGGTINAALISSGYNTGTGLALDGFGNLFWADNYGGAGGNVVGAYTASGQVENAALIKGVSNPVGIAIVPEPSSGGLTVLGIMCIVAFLKKSKVLRLKPNGHPA